MTLQKNRTVKVLIVEDSRVIADFLSHSLSSDPQIKVVGTVFDGSDVVEAVLRTKPDVITMDIHMPIMDGFEATRSLMENCPTPVVIVSGSASVNEVATNFRAIEVGALTVIGRPAGIGHPNHETSIRELIQTVKLMSEVKVVRRWPGNRVAKPAKAVEPPMARPAVSSEKAELIAIGVSTGGPLALQTIFSKLPRNFPMPILVVQHLSPGFTQGFVEWLSSLTGFPVHVAVEGEAILPGQAYVAPENFQMGVKDNRIVLSKDGPENGMRPCVSFLFRSVQKAFGSRAVGVLLTGMGEDGAEELKQMRDAGAITIAQDKESSVVHGMPGHAIKIDAAQYILPPEGIAKALVNLAYKL
jgi:two-component system chemotaxis response regulator CheB